MLGASLSEVWGEDFNTKPKKKKRKIKTTAPLTPDEMNADLLVQEKDKNKLNIDEYHRLKSLEEEYNEIQIPRNSNEVSARYPYGRTPSRLEDDPDYFEFMEYKKMKRKNQIKNQRIKDDEKISDPRIRIDPNQQLNELLLYIFTGFFLLLLYDNIYRFGKKSY
tara:strand:- start:2199 stop:2690 length:492 start_codon:yes stop_codon:yes gene_type:complete